MRTISSASATSPGDAAAGTKVAARTNLQVFGRTNINFSGGLNLKVLDTRQVTAGVRILGFVTILDRQTSEIFGGLPELFSSFSRADAVLGNVYPRDWALNCLTWKVPAKKACCPKE